MKTAACIALLALAATACSKNDTTQTPAGMTTSPGTENVTATDTATTAQTQMPAVETAAPNEITTGAPAGNGATAGSTTNAYGAPTGNGVTDGSSTVWAPGAGPTAGNPATSPTPAPSRPDADNTRVNERDRGPSTTPMDQGNNDTDLKITQKIRQAVMGDGGLSFTAKNVKIITNKGTVVLRGPVKSDDERSRIDAAAKSVAGSSNVINEIEIKK
jgi:hyperosmotically inducible protein